MVEITSIERLTMARTLLAEAKDMDDILKVRDISEAARTYAKAAKLGLESQNEAAEIKIRAERKAGDLLARLERDTEFHGNQAVTFHDGKSPPSEYREVL